MNILSPISSSWNLLKRKHLLCSPELIEKETAVATPNEDLVEEDKIMAIMFLHRSDPSRYGRLTKSLKESIQMGRDEYPVMALSLW